MNEEAVGRAVKRANDDEITTRDELFITTKIWVQGMTDEETAYQAMKDYFAAYRGMERAYREGLVHAVGVANFFPETLTNLCETVDVIPAVNQVELHLFFVQEAAVQNMKAYAVIPQAWGPLAEGKHGIFTDPELTVIGKKYGKTAAQVALRWNTQRGVSIIPKSTHVERLEQNLDIWDFSLTDDEMKTVASKDLGHSEIINHYDPALVKFLDNMKIYD